MGKILLYILAIAAAFGAYCIDSSMREKNQMIQDMKSEINKLKDATRRAEESKRYYEEKAEKYENAYHSLYEDYEKLKQGGINDTNSTLY